MAVFDSLALVNLALSFIGVKPITQSDWDSPVTVPALRATIYYDMAAGCVLAEEDWYFAKYRVALTYDASFGDQYKDMGWQYAYQLPSDFLRLAKPTKTRTKLDLPVFPPYIFFGRDFKIQMVHYVPTVGEAQDIKCLLTDYDNSQNDLYIVYISNQGDPAAWTEPFCEAVSWKLAEYLAWPLTESATKVQACASGYDFALASAQANNKANDYVEDEAGNSNWEDAGRIYIRR